MRIAVAACAAALWMSGPAEAAESITGVWQTQPDRKDLVSHIEVTACGEEYCARILRAFDPSGAEVQTKNIGKSLFWGMKPQGDGTFSGGTAYVPLLNTTTSNVDLTLQGDRLRVEGRVGLMRGAQVWERLP